MELEDLARAVLYGARIEDKLTSAEVLTDLRPGPAEEAPEAPGRPAGLELSTPSGRARAPFPSATELRNPSARGLALHYFANHELLAMELMALMLLRFPDAPPEFRMGLARTLADEQRHFRMYLARMEALGVGLGDAALNAFFWRAIRDVPSPLEFVVRMSLTFEQANLDFTRHYAELFRTHGDEPTARVLDVVFADEIRHVAHGVTWFDAWRDPKERDFDAYQRMVRPLSPARAKGPSFQWKARRTAGLSEDFVREISACTENKTRKPVLFVFNPDCEDELAGGPGYTPTRAVRALTEDLAPLALFLAIRGDRVRVPRRPSSAHLERLAVAGFEIPELEEADTNAAVPGPDEVSRIVPWGWSGRLRSAAAGAGHASLSASPSTLSKVWGLEVAHRFARTRGDLEEWTGADVLGRAAGSMDEVRAAVAAFGARGFGEVLIKAPFSSSGRHRLRVRSDVPLEMTSQRWIERTLDGQLAVVVEPWLDRVFDLGLALSLDSDRPDPLMSCARFFTNARGAYLGHQLGPTLHGLSREDLRALHERGDPTEPLFAAARFAAEALAAEGFSGLASVDALIHRDSAGRPWLKPIVEVNARTTMGHVARRLGQHLGPGRVALWLHARWSEAGAEMLIAAPPVETTIVSRHRRIVSGVVATSDPTQAQAVLTALIVDVSLQACRARAAVLPGFSI